MKDIDFITLVIIYKKKKISSSYFFYQILTYIGIPDSIHNVLVSLEKKQNLKCKTTKNNVINSYKEDYFFDRKIREDRVLDDLDRLFQNQVSKSLPNTLKNIF